MVYHVLADGTITNDITGRVVKVSDAESLYHLMSNTKIHKDKKEVHKEEKKNVV